MRFRDDTKSEAANLSEARKIYIHLSFLEPAKTTVSDIENDTEFHSTKNTC